MNILGWEKKYWKLSSKPPLKLTIPKNIIGNIVINLSLPLFRGSLGEVFVLIKIFRL